MQKCHCVCGFVLTSFQVANLLNTDLIYKVFTFQVGEMRPLFIIGQMRPNSLRSRLILSARPNSCSATERTGSVALATSYKVQGDLVTILWVDG